MNQFEKAYAVQFHDGIMSNTHVFETMEEAEKAAEMEKKYNPTISEVKILGGETEETPYGKEIVEYEEINF
jgi:hypothetical protein